MSESISISLSTTSDDTWINLEQVYDSETDAISEYDVSQMLARVMSGESAATYIDETCTYMRVEDGVLYVDLDFYVWPYDLDVPYSLSTNLGTISEAEYVELYSSFDVVFEGTDEVEHDFLLDGEVTQSMDVFSTNGVLLTGKEFIVSDNVVYTDQEVYTVLRFEGKVMGYKHTVSMPFKLSEYLPSLLYTVSGIFKTNLTVDFDNYPITVNSEAYNSTWTIDFYSSMGYFYLKDSNGLTIDSGSVYSNFVTDWFTINSSAWESYDHTSSLTFSITDSGVDPEDARIKYSVSNLDNEVFVSWVEGGETNSSALTLDIPSCVSTLLSVCEDDSDSDYEYDESESEIYNVYYSTCDGEVVEVRKENSSGKYYKVPAK